MVAQGPFVARPATAFVHFEKQSARRKFSKQLSPIKRFPSNFYFVGAGFDNPFEAWHLATNSTPSKHLDVFLLSWRCMPALCPCFSYNCGRDEEESPFYLCSRREQQQKQVVS